MSRPPAAFRCLAALALLVALSTAAPAAPPPPPPDQIGEWSSVYTWPDVAIHLHMLPDGKVLSFSDDDNPNYLVDGSRLEGSTRAFVVDIPTGGTPAGWVEIPNTRTNVFCSGHAFLPDGRLLVAGGHKGTDGHGEAETNLFRFNTTWQWQTGANMNAGRWYPTAVSLPNGDVLVVGGSIHSGESNDLPEVWDTALSSWRPLSSALLTLPYYPFLHVAPNGQVFCSGPGTTTRYINPSGTGTWTTVDTRVGGSRDYGSGVMYRPGKVLAVGGGDPPKRTAEVIDLNAATPDWRAVASMADTRRQLNATILPDGTVLVTGGTSGSGFNNFNGAVYTAELWDPDTEDWTTMASMSVARLYHSSVVLLPDARVLSVGGGRPKASNGGTDNENCEIFSPPYLFKGPRPTLDASPASAGLGQTLFLSTPDADSITRVTLVRLSTTTHALNMGQRFNELTFTPAAGGLLATLPSSANLCPPGHYWLFILNDDGVPSVARVIQVTTGSLVSVPGLSDRPLLLATSANPTSRDATFELTIDRPRRASVQVVDVSGRRIDTLLEAQALDAGTYRLGWDGRDASRGLAPNGLYFVVASVGDQRAVRRVSLLR